MKAIGSKAKIRRKLTKKTKSTLDWDNKKCSPGLIRRLIKATYDEDYFYFI